MPRFFLNFGENLQTAFGFFWARPLKVYTCSTTTYHPVRPSRAAIVYERASSWQPPCARFQCAPLVCPPSTSLGARCQRQPRAHTRRERVRIYEQECSDHGAKMKKWRQDHWFHYFGSKMSRLRRYSDPFGKVILCCTGRRNLKAPLDVAVSCWQASEKKAQFKNSHGCCLEGLLYVRNRNKQKEWRQCSQMMIKTKRRRLVMMLII